MRDFELETEKERCSAAKYRAAGRSSVRRSRFFPNVRPITNWELRRSVALKQTVISMARHYKKAEQNNTQVPILSFWRAIKQTLPFWFKKWMDFWAWDFAEFVPFFSIFCPNSYFCVLFSIFFLMNQDNLRCEGLKKFHQHAIIWNFLAGLL